MDIYLSSLAGANIFVRERYNSWLIESLRSEDVHTVYRSSTNMNWLLLFFFF